MVNVETVPLPPHLDGQIFYYITPPVGGIHLRFHFADGLWLKNHPALTGYLSFKERSWELFI
jgi:hypothetical protein